MNKIILKNEKHTAYLGAILAEVSNKGDLVMLSGELGSGKTVIARGFIRKRLKKNIAITSPTFTIVNIYDNTNPPVWHFDLYRIRNTFEIDELGLNEALKEGITLIEWPSIANKWLPNDRLEITIKNSNIHNKRVVLLNPSPNWIDRTKEIINCINEKNGI